MIVIDTHIWLWWISNPEKLSANAAKAIDNACRESRIIISSISVWEIAILNHRGRLKLTIDSKDWVRKTESLPFIRFIPVDNTIALCSVNLPGLFHPDPADRIITATAMTMDLPLVTRDKKIIEYPHVKTIWF